LINDCGQRSVDVCASIDRVFILMDPESKSFEVDMLTKIISTGLTAADRAALEAAVELCIPTGGTAPKGWRIQNYDGSTGSDPELAQFGLVEHESAEYPPRTRQNVADCKDFPITERSVGIECDGDRLCSISRGVHRTESEGDSR
jgi:hypothetical protein